jgi:CDP-diacylglycerol--glycerol-3-phosphate 3-phosphatidyltransferase
MLLSPLADKLLISTAYITLIRFAPTMVSAWIAVLIVGREFLVTGLSSVASVVAVLMAHAWPRWTVGSAVLPGREIAVGFIWMTLALSLLSAASYFRSFWVEAKLQSRQKHKPLPFVLKRPDDKNARAR